MVPDFSNFLVLLTKTQNSCVFLYIMLFIPRVRFFNSCHSSLHCGKWNNPKMQMLFKPCSLQYFLNPPGWKAVVWVSLSSLPVSKVGMQKMFLASSLIVPNTKIVEKLKWDLLLAFYQSDDENCILWANNIVGNLHGN